MVTRMPSNRCKAKGTERMVIENTANVHQTHFVIARAFGEWNRSPDLYPMFEGAVL
jgi:hypothetical protein